MRRCVYTGDEVSSTCVRDDNALWYTLSGYSSDQSIYGSVQWRQGPIHWHRLPHSHAVAGDWSEDA